MQRLAQVGGGALYTVENKNGLHEAVAADLNAPALLEYEILPFSPTVSAVNSPIIEGVAETSLSVQLGGVYTTRLKMEAEAILLGAYNLPVYAQWSYGEGKVGSFMCDFGGEWSVDFIESEEGKRIFYNIIAHLQGATTKSYAA